jgi:tRNA-Thr(GGU) m(6)t(6)A37 methyltransferase TsaA
VKRSAGHVRRDRRQRGRSQVIVEMVPVGFVAAARARAEDDYWGGEQATISLVESFTAEALRGLDEFSHVEVSYFFHAVEPAQVVTGARHPRGNPAWPRVGIFAQRARGRPNRLGSTICRLLRVEAKSLVVAELDAIDGTPVLDIKPVMEEFLPRGALRQPQWSRELMRHYWQSR